MTRPAEAAGPERSRQLKDAEPLLVVVGPTASGKTELAVRLSEALGGEIVSADSVQVYRGFDIGTGKPSAAELARAPHHLIDVVSPHEPMDAASWAALAETAVADIEARGKKPIVCGGSFLFVRALVWGLAEMPAADPAIRARHQQRAAREGRAALWAELHQRDPERAAELAPNDLVRVSRALEILELSGVPMSEWQRRHGFREQRRPARFLGVARERTVQDARIERRVRAMLAAGWVAEVRELLAAGHADTRPMASVGYRQISERICSGSALESEVELEQLASEITRATRVFARRQRTWLRDQPVEWLAPGDLPPSASTGSRPINS